MHCKRVFLLKGSCWGTQLCQWLLSLWFPLNWFISSILRLNCTGCSAHFHYILLKHVANIFYQLGCISWIKHTLFITVSYYYWWYYYPYYSCNSLVCFLWVRLSVAGKGWWISANSLKIREYLCGKISLSKWKSTGCQHHRRLVPP